MERTHAGRLDPRADDPLELVSLAVIDVSSSLSANMRGVGLSVKPSGDVVALVKPQFELSPREVPKGVVRSAAPEQQPPWSACASMRPRSGSDRSAASSLRSVGPAGNCTSSSCISVCRPAHGIGFASTPPWTRPWCGHSAWCAANGIDVWSAPASEYDVLAEELGDGHGRHGLFFVAAMVLLLEHPHPGRQRRQGRFLCPRRSQTRSRRCWISYRGESSRWSHGWCWRPGCWAPGEGRAERCTSRSTRPPSSAARRRASCDWNCWWTIPTWPRTSRTDSWWPVPPARPATHSAPAARSWTRPPPTSW